MERRRVLLGHLAALRHAGDAGGQQEGTARTGEGVADRPHGLPFGAGGVGGAGEVVLVGEVDDGLGGLGARPDAVEVVEVTAADPDALRGERGGRASERASPSTSWPAASSSSTTAEPIQPEAPVTKTRMGMVSFEAHQGAVEQVTSVTDVCR